MKNRNFEIKNYKNCIIDETGQTFIDCLDKTSQGTFIVPDGVKIIETQAFENCMFDEIILPETVVSIFDSAFFKCENLRKINIPSKVEVINDSVFFGCVSLEKINLNNNIQVISTHAFENCKSLKKIIFSKSLHTIFDNAFANCTSLKEIKFPHDIRLIGAFAFENCTKLEKVEFPDYRLSNIRSFAFKNCKSLKEIKLPNSLSFLGSGVFNGTSITQIHIPPVMDLKDDFISGMPQTKVYISECLILEHPDLFKDFEGTVVMSDSIDSLLRSNISLSEINKIAKQLNIDR